MAMSDFVLRDAIVPALTATNKEGVIREMVDALAGTGLFAQDGEREEIVKAILRREQLGSTGIGRGIAIPHAKPPTAERLFGNIALSRQGVGFDSLDGEPVYIFVLLLSPQDRPGDHLRALENVVRTMKEENFVKALRQCSTRDEVWKLLTDGPTSP